MFMVTAYSVAEKKFKAKHLQQGTLTPVKKSITGLTTSECRQIEGIIQIEAVIIVLPTSPLITMFVVHV